MDNKNYLQLHQIVAYTKAFHLSDCVSNWGNFAKYSIGQQYVDAVDSVSANIAEGFGRFHKKDKIKIHYYSLGSVKECLDWNEKSRIRKLITDENYKKIFDVLQNCPKKYIL